MVITIRSPSLKEETGKGHDLYSPISFAQRRRRRGMVSNILSLMLKEEIGGKHDLYSPISYT